MELEFIGLENPILTHTSDINDFIRCGRRIDWWIKGYVSVHMLSNLDGDVSMHRLLGTGTAGLLLAADEVHSKINGHTQECHGHHGLNQRKAFLVILIPHCTPRTSPWCCSFWPDHPWPVKEYQHTGSDRHSLDSCPGKRHSIHVGHNIFHWKS